MVSLWFQGSGIAIITASGSSIPLITRNSSVLSSIAESEPDVLTTGSTFVMSSALNAGARMVSSRASILSALPRMVLISPLWTIKRFGWARSQLGLVLVEKRECTIAIAES